MSFAHFGTQSIVAFLRLGRIFSDSLMIIVRLFPSEGIPHPSADCHQRRLLYLVDHEFWPLGQFLCGDHQILALQHLLNLRSLHPVCADCCFVSPGQGPRDWVGTVLRTVFCCWPCYRCWRNQEFIYTGEAQVLPLLWIWEDKAVFHAEAVKSAPLISREFAVTLSILQMPDGLGVFFLPSQITFSTCCLCLWAQILHGKYQPEVSWVFWFCFFWGGGGLGFL